MSKAKRIFFIGDTKDFTPKLLLVGLRKQVKGFIRLGHDTQVFSYNEAMSNANPIRRMKITRRLCKLSVDKLLVGQIRNYKPDIIVVNFPKYADRYTVQMMREAAGNAVFVGLDVDLWPELHRSRVETAAELDMVFTTYGVNGQKALGEAGVRCIFMPNMCDPDIEYRYEVSDRWKSDILFTGKLKHIHYPTEALREQLISRVAQMDNSAVYGCCGGSFIGGIQYLYAISGARIGLSINAVNDIRLYHSDRFSQYLSCGTFVLAKRVPDSELLFADGVHLKYFDSVEEFFDLAKWYLRHEDERLKIANAGMERMHREFNCVKIAEYTLEAIETGTYSAPWVADR